MNPKYEKSAAAVAPAAAEVAPAPEVSLSLTDFCARLSETVRRPELIGAFHSSESKLGNVRATDATFRARFAEFRNKPI